MEVIDPESSGLTNDVSGRLSFFTKGDDQGPKNEECASALATPSKEQSHHDFVEVDADMEGDAVVVGEEAQADDLLRQRDAFLASLKGLPRQEVRNKVGEELYVAINKSHPTLAGKLTGMFLEATENLEDLSLLLFSPSSLQLHLSQAVTVLESVAAAAPPADTTSSATSSPTQTPSGPSPSRATELSSHEEASGAKRVHPRETTARQYPYNGKKARTERGESGRPWFAEIVDDSGKRTKVPCKYDAEKRMYVPTGGRDVVPGGKVGTRDKTAEDLQALDIGESDEGKLRARQKQLDIGKNTLGFKKLIEQKLTGSQLQDIIRLPYITEEGVLELTLKCSKKRYDGYLRMWKRKLYEYAGLQRLDFKGFPPLPEEAENTATSIIFETTDTLTNAAPPTPDDAVVVSSAPAPRGRKQSNPARLPTASAQAPQGSWAKKLS